jgi:cathepsin A (carboxypeptidase C)
MFDTFESWQHRDFYIAGESYGGSYVPALASRIQARKTSPLSIMAATISNYEAPKIKLSGVLIGNGLMNVAVQRRGIYDTGCTGAEPLLDASACDAVMSASSRCEALEEACKESGYVWSVCRVSSAFCQENGFSLFNATERDSNYFPRKCGHDNDGCGDNNTDLVAWMESPLVKKGLAVDEAVNFTAFSWQVARDFMESGEVGYPSDFYVSELLDQVRNMTSTCNHSDDANQHFGRDRALRF